MHGDEREAHENKMWDEFQKENPGSYDMERFREWYRNRLYSPEGLKILEMQKSQESNK